MTGAAALRIRFDILSTPITFCGFRVCSLDNIKVSFIGLDLNTNCVLFARGTFMSENFEAQLVATVEKYWLNVSAI